MKDNIKKAETRGINLKGLEEKAEKLENDSQIFKVFLCFLTPALFIDQKTKYYFQKSAGKVKRKKQCENIKMKLIIGGVISAIIIVIIIISSV